MLFPVLHSEVPWRRSLQPNGEKFLFMAELGIRKTSKHQRPSTGVVGVTRVGPVFELIDLTLMQKPQL